MNGQFLIPANSKKSLLYFNVFNKFDLLLFGGGILTTVSLLVLFPNINQVILMFFLAPGVITGFLVMPVPNYHNMRTVIKNVFIFFTSRQKFIWKGWCFIDGKSSKK